jgi:UDP-glucose 4-epimerase
MKVSKKSYQRIVILGSNSFIAKYFIKYLKKNKINFLPINRKKIDFEKKNSSKYLSKVIRDNDTCVFVAANAPVRNEKMFLSNILMAKNICNSIKTKNIKHFIYVSSDAVYADSKKKIKETSKKEPDNLHGLMHLTREMMVKTIIDKKKLTIVRPTLIYGEGDPHNGYGPNQFLKLIRQKKNIKLFGKGEELRDHIQVEDVAFMLYLIAKKNITGEFNLVTGKVISFLNIAKQLIKNHDSKIKIIFLKRTGPIPHNGYRAFCPSSLVSKIKNLKIKTLI